MNSTHNDITEKNTRRVNITNPVIEVIEFTKTNQLKSKLYYSKYDYIRFENEENKRSNTKKYKLLKDRMEFEKKHVFKINIEKKMPKKHYSKKEKRKKYTSIYNRRYQKREKLIFLKMNENLIFSLKTLQIWNEKNKSKN